MPERGRLGLVLPLVAGTCAAVAAGCASTSSNGGAPVTDPGFNAVLSDDYDPYFAASIYYGGGFLYAVSTSEAAAVAACVPDVKVVSTAMDCNEAYDANVSLAWSCSSVGTEQAAVNGSAQVITVVVPDACPANDVATTKTATLSRRRAVGRDSIETNGSVTASWTARAGIAAPSLTLTRNVSRRIFRDASLQLDQTIRATHTVQLAYGPANTPDRWSATGTGVIDFRRDGFTVMTTDVDLEFTNGCCYPISGATQYTITGSRTGGGTLTFGPACGSLGNDAGDTFTLPTCTP